MGAYNIHDIHLFFADFHTQWKNFWRTSGRSTSRKQSNNTVTWSTTKISSVSTSMSSTSQMSEVQYLIRKSQSHILSHEQSCRPVWPYNITIHVHIYWFLAVVNDPSLSAGYPGSGTTLSTLWRYLSIIFLCDNVHIFYIRSWSTIGGSISWVDVNKWLRRKTSLTTNLQESCLQHDWQEGIHRHRHVPVSAQKQG